MKKKVALLVLISFLLSLGCIGKNVSTEEATSSSLGESILLETTITATTVLQKSSSTLLNESPAADTTTTSTSVFVPVVRECENFSDMNRDLCYSGIAMTYNNASFCDQVKNEAERRFCLENVGLENEEGIVTLKGRVVNKFTGKGYSNLTVLVYSTQDNETVLGSARTDVDGKYSLEVPFKEGYNIVVKIGQQYPTKTLANIKNGMTYVAYFILK